MRSVIIKKASQQNQTTITTIKLNINYTQNSCALKKTYEQAQNSVG